MFAVPRVRRIDAARCTVTLMSLCSCHVQPHTQAVYQCLEEQPRQIMVRATRTAGIHIVLLQPNTPKDCIGFLRDQGTHACNLLSTYSQFSNFIFALNVWMATRVLSCLVSSFNSQLVTFDLLRCTAWLPTMLECLVSTVSTCYLFQVLAMLDPPTQ